MYAYKYSKYDLEKGKKEFKLELFEDYAFNISVGEKLEYKFKWYLAW